MDDKDRQWIRYSPEGRNTEYDHKMNLRNMVNTMGMLGPKLPITTILKSDSEDDNYVLNLDGEEIKIKASENGQRNNAESGIFFLTEPSKKDKVEGILMRLFDA
ncbi:hypothetical protein HOE04_00285 [archaeon]|jgi:hypothetical protein|nr:hypothetical protein [archaeon]